MEKERRTIRETHKQKDGLEDGCLHEGKNLGIKEKEGPRLEPLNGRHRKNVKDPSLNQAFSQETLGGDRRKERQSERKSSKDNLSRGRPREKDENSLKRKAGSRKKNHLGRVT